MEEDIIFRLWWANAFRPLWSKNFLRAERKEKAEEFVKLAFTNRSFRKRLMANPNSLFLKLGMAIPKGRTVKVVQNTPETMYMVLPILSKPREYEKIGLSQYDLKDQDLTSNVIAQVSGSSHDDWDTDKFPDQDPIWYGGEHTPRDPKFTRIKDPSTKD